MPTENNSDSLVPFQNQGIAKVEKSILITNKILSESEATKRYYYEWWNNLSDLWKKILMGTSKNHIFPFSFSMILI